METKGWRERRLVHITLQPSGLLLLDSLSAEDGERLALGPFSAALRGGRRPL